MRELAALDMEGSLALVREGTRQSMVACANLADAPAAVHKAGVSRVPPDRRSGAQAFRICMTSGSDAFTHAPLYIEAEIAIAQNDNFNSAVTITAFDATSANGGTVSMTTSGAGIGQFTYNPKAGYTGADSFNYTISNAHGSSSATVHLTLSGLIWFINNTASAGDGRLGSPFNSLAAFQALTTAPACTRRPTPISSSTTARPAIPVRSLC
jgi:hypothetical protein